MAINTCLTSLNHVTAFDRYGNNTTLRSAFLYNKTGEGWTEDQVMQRLTFGTDENNQDQKGYQVVFKKKADNFI